MSLIIFVLIWCLVQREVLAVSQPFLVSNTQYFASVNLIEIERIVLKNSTILTPKQQTEITQEWLGEYPVSQLTEKGLEWANTLTKIYHDLGYQTSWAVFPPQSQLSDGVLIIEVFEGELEEISIRGELNLHSHNWGKKLLPCQVMSQSIDRNFLGIIATKP